MHVVNSSNSSSNSQIAQIELINQGKALYTTNCAACHAPIDTSSKMGRSVLQIRSAIQTISQMRGLATLPAKDLEAISAALIYQANGGGVEENKDGRLQYTCTPGLYSKNPLLKLTNREFINSLNQILDGFSPNLKSDTQLANFYNSLPPDAITVDRNTIKEQSQLVTQLSTNAFFNAAYRAAQLVAQETTGLGNYAGTNRCLEQSTITQACHRTFVRQLASRAFRKTLSQTEGNMVSDTFWDASLSKENLLILTFAGILQSPEFLYKVFNKGTPVPNRQNLLALTQHEIATKVAFFITGAPPDDDLRAAADAGQLTSKSILSAQVDRLLATPGAQDMIRRLFRESYGYDVYDSFNYNSSFINGISTSGLQQAMNSELDSFFSYTVLNQNGIFNDLFTSRYANISNTSLRQIYGINSTGEMTLPAERAGFLNRAAMLTKRSGYRASPIKRGLDVLEHVLCVNVGAPPPSAPTALPDYNGEILTTRGNTERTSQAPGSTCIGCHGRFNPLGYAFEIFDSFGRLRTVERVYDGSGNMIASLPINSQSSSPEIHAAVGRSPATVVSFTDSIDLSADIGQSDRAMMCFVKHLKKFEARKDVGATDNCQMNESLTSLYGSTQRPGSIKEAIRALVLSQEFIYWSY
ncbi:DUF1592 domain-containing protein [bacterium]|nr:DUF1592 domain-containing protein [bacterium]